MLNLLLEAPEETLTRLESGALRLPGVVRSRRLGALGQRRASAGVGLAEIAIHTIDELEPLVAAADDHGGAVFHNAIITSRPRRTTCPPHVVGVATDVPANLRGLTPDGGHSVIFVADGGFKAGELTVNRRPTVRFASALDKNLASGPSGGFAASHGAMMAWDCTLAAPNATLVNIVMPGNSEQNAATVLRVVEHLTDLHERRELDAFTGLVVSCAWDCDNVDEDLRLPPHIRLHGNDRHPLREAVDGLVDLGFDVVIAAGNRGCGMFARPIAGMNAFPTCITVGAVALDRQPDPLSSLGDASTLKPDLAAFANFGGGADGGVDAGTSAATGVAAGIIATIRSMPGQTRRDIPAGDSFIDHLKQRITGRPPNTLTEDDHSPKIGVGILR